MDATKMETAQHKASNNISTITNSPHSWIPPSSTSLTLSVSSSSISSSTYTSPSSTASTLPADSSFFTSSNGIIYQITYDWSLLKMKSSAPSTMTSCSEKHCVCNYKWRFIFHGLNLCLFVSLFLIPIYMVINSYTF